MKIEYHPQPPTKTMTLDAFATKHDLTMEVHERVAPMPGVERYYAHFKRAEVRAGTSFLRGSCGNGPTPEDAMRDCAAKISGRLLIVDADGEARREIRVPRIVFEEPKAPERCLVCNGIGGHGAGRQGTSAYEELVAKNNILIRGIKAVESLINESHGVTGLHMNGDDAQWCELRSGGRFEEWLIDFDTALNAIPNKVLDQTTFCPPAP